MSTTIHYIWISDTDDRGFSLAGTVRAFSENRGCPLSGAKANVGRFVRLWTVCAQDGWSSVSNEVISVEGVNFSQQFSVQVMQEHSGKLHLKI